MEPLGIGEYVLMEMPVPGVPERERWKAALRHVEEAQKHFRMGNDAAVLQSCHAAFESLEGAPKNILERVADEKKRPKYVYPPSARPDSQRLGFSILSNPARRFLLKASR